MENSIELRSEKVFEKVSFENFKHAGNQILEKLKIAITPPNILVVQEEEKIDLIRKYHENALRGGHSGVKRTIEKLKIYYEWQNMSKQVHEYIRQCKDCKLNKIGKLWKTNTPLKPFEVVQIDLQGPFLR